MVMPVAVASRNDPTAVSPMVNRRILNRPYRSDRPPMMMDPTAYPISPVASATKVDSELDRWNCFTM